MKNNLRQNDPVIFLITTKNFKLKFMPNKSKIKVIPSLNLNFSRVGTQYTVSTTSTLNEGRQQI